MKLQNAFIDILVKQLRVKYIIEIKATSLSQLKQFQ